MRLEKLPSIERDLRLDHQFTHPETLRLAGEDIQVHDVRPDKEKTEVSVFFGLGWSATPEVYRENIMELARRGRRVISPDAPHGVDAEPAGGYPAAELRKVAAVIKTLEEKNIAKVDAVAHSESGIYLTIAAMMYPERFRSIVFVDAAGIIGPDKLPRLAAGFSLDIVKQLVNEALKAEPVNPLESKKWNPLREINAKKIPPKLPWNPLGAVKVLAEKPLQSIRSVFAIANADLRDMIDKLREKGIRIAVIQAESSSAFSEEKIKETMKGRADQFYSLPGTHNSVILDPERYTSVIDRALDAMEKEHARQTGSGSE